jgi:predicted PurR-regulated permease PerM
VLRIDWTRVLVVQLSILAGIVLLVVAWNALHAVVHTLLLFAIAAVLAFVLAPLVTRSEERGLPRLAAVALVYLAFAAALAISTGLLLRPFTIQAALLLDNLPRYVANLQDQIFWLDDWLQRFGLGGGATALQTEASRQFTTTGTVVVGDLLRLLTQVAGSALDSILVLVISFYLLLDGPRLHDAAITLVPREHRPKAEFLEENLGRVVGGYLRGQLVMALTLALLVGVTMTLLGMPYALVLAVLAGVFELVPMLGPILSALPALAVALFQPFPMVLWVFLFFLGIQQLEAHVLGPRITGHAVGLHPLGAIFALLAGLELGGPLAAVFAVPLAGFLWVVAVALYRRTIGAPEPQPRQGWRLPRRRPHARPAVAAEPQAAPPPDAL